MAAAVAPPDNGADFPLPALIAPSTPRTADEYDSSSSRLTTPASRSPTPPPELAKLFSSFPLSPVSSQQSSKKGTPDPDMGSTDEDDGPPPAKRRKSSHPATDGPKQGKDAKEAKPRVAEYLDLTGAPVDKEQKAQISKLLKVLHKKRKIVVIAGAGISVSAGIPDFRSSTGLFTTLKAQHNLKSSGKDLFDASVYKDNHATSNFHDMVRSLSEQSKSAQPTPFHHLLAELASQGRLLRLYTQNVDGLDTALEPLASQVPLKPKDGKWPKTIQVHGSLEKMVCTKCHVVSDFQSDLFNGPVPPDCKDCQEHDNVRTNMAGKRSHGVGKLRPRMVLYQEMNPDEEAIGSVVRADLKTRPDALIVVGTTLKVPGVKRIAKEMCRIVNDRKDGGLTVWISNDPPPPGNNYNWNLVVKGTCDRVAELAKLPEQEALSLGEVVTFEDIQRAKSLQEVEIQVLSPSKRQALGLAQLPTPGASPHLKPLPLDQPHVPGTPTKSRKSLLGEKAAKAPKATKSAKVAAGKPKKPAAQSRKAPTAANKTKPAPTNRKINTSFKVSKAAKASVDKLAESKNGSQQISDTILVSPSRTKDFPTKLTIKLPKFPSGKPMAPIAPQEARNNTAPPFAQSPAEVMEGASSPLSSDRESFGVPARGLPKDARCIMN